MLQALGFFALVEVVGLAAAPLAGLAFGRLPGSGLGFGKPLGVLLVTWLVWIAASLGIASYGVGLIAGAGAVLLVAGLPAALRAMKSATLGPAESIELSAVLHPGQSITDRYRAEREVARYVDALRPPRGSVLVDTFSAVPIFLSSRRPDQFVITSDRDFRIVLADPSLYGVRYVLARSPTGLGQLDAVNREFPFLYRTGRPLGTLVRQFTNRGNQRPTWRLYAVSRTVATSTAGDGRRQGSSVRAYVAMRRGRFAR